VFECLACNLLQISPIELCFEKLRFLKKCVLRMQEMQFRDPQFKNFLRGRAPRPMSAVLGSHLRRSHTILGAGKENSPQGRSDGGIGGGGWLTPNFFRINIFRKPGWPFGKLGQ
jgi:hypothetical protein